MQQTRTAQRATSKPSGFEERFRATINRIVHYLTSEFEGGKAVDSISVSQLKVLRELSNGPMWMTSIASLTGVTPGAATGMIDKLVGKKLVRRYEDRKNRRVILVDLTALGDELQKAVHKRTLRRVQRLLRHFAPEDKEELVRLFQLFDSAIVEDAADLREPPPRTNQSPWAARPRR